MWRDRVPGLPGTSLRERRERGWTVVRGLSRVTLGLCLFLTIAALLMVGFLQQWPTLFALAMFPVLVTMDIRPCTPRGLHVLPMRA